MRKCVSKWLRRPRVASSLIFPVMVYNPSPEKIKVFAGVGFLIGVRVELVVRFGLGVRLGLGLS